MKRIVKFLKHYIFILDLFILALSFTVLYLLLPHENGIGDNDLSLLVPHLVTFILSVCFWQFTLKTYNNLWRFAECKEFITLIFGGVLGFITYSYINCYFLTAKISTIFIIAVCGVSNLNMILLRLLYRRYQQMIAKSKRNKISLAIIGAGGAGVILLEEIRSNPESKYDVYCFFDDDKEKIGKKIRGIAVLGPIDKMNDSIKHTPIKEVILAIPSLESERKQEILCLLSKLNINVKVLPDLLSILQDKKANLLSIAKDLNMEELLGRETISFNKKEIETFLGKKTILVTGGGGSIGSELCRQIAKYSPNKIIIIDNYENNAYEIQQELMYLYKESLSFVVEIASVQDKQKIELLISKYKPDVVFHAAAHKHVPFMEDCPEEAIKNNIFGTYNVVKASAMNKVKKFVLISTDKAVNPTSVMGATKRMCEMIIESMKGTSNTEFVAVRFGNVLGSNGSVIPLFVKQIKGGGPVTITDKRAFRYFMTIPEAAELVLRAGSMASNGEIYVLDMGHPVSILTLAENLITLLGFEPYTQIPILEIGLRPGEKLYEELLMQGEELEKTANQKIYIEKKKGIEFEEIEEKLHLLSRALENKDKEEIIRALKVAVPTFFNKNYS